MQYLRVLEADDTAWPNEKIWMDYHLEVEWRKPEIKKEGRQISFPKRIVLRKQGYRKNFQFTEEELLKAVRREGVENPKTISTFKVRRRAENFRN